MIDQNSWKLLLVIKDVIMRNYKKIQSKVVAPGCELFFSVITCCCSKLYHIFTKQHILKTNCLAMQ